MKTKELVSMTAKGFIAALACVCVLSACSSSDDPDAPAVENETEDITNLAVVFTPAEDGVVIPGGAVVRAEIVDPDGFKGPEPLESIGTISLKQNTEYQLTFEIVNQLAPEGDQNTCDEIQEESLAHQFYFGFEDNIFTAPVGTGNIGDDVQDPKSKVIYNDYDTEGNPLGLHTEWTTGDKHEALTDFHVVLKHKPGEKGANDTTAVGENDIDVTFELNVVE